MSSTTIKKVALGFALLAFGILTFGSAIAGARPFTSFLRGIEAAVVFGLLAWSMGYILTEREEEKDFEKSLAAPDEKKKGENIKEIV